MSNQYDQKKQNRCCWFLSLCSQSHLMEPSTVLEAIQCAATDSVLLHVLHCLSGDPSGPGLGYTALLNRAYAKLHGSVPLDCSTGPTAAVTFSPEDNMLAVWPIIVLNS